MAIIHEIGPTHSIDRSQWGENYSESRHLGHTESEIAKRQFIFSFASYLHRMSGRFSELNILDSGCGEGSAVADLVTLGRKLSIPLTITAITKDPRHKENLMHWANEIVIGTTEHFFEMEERRHYYHFILDYQGALGRDNASKIIPIYGRILKPDGGALLTFPSDINLDFFKENGIEFQVGTRNCAFFSKQGSFLWR